MIQRKAKHGVSLGSLALIFSGCSLASAPKSSTPPREGESTSDAGTQQAVTISVTPSSASLVLGDSATFVAAVSGSDDKGVQWSLLEGAAAGRITADGVYTATTKLVGVYHVVATSRADRSATATATVAVSKTAPVVAVPPVMGTPTIEVRPASTLLGPGASTPFACDVAGASGHACSWSVQEGGAGGTITSTGVYTAPTVAGSYHVIASSEADPTKTATAAVTVALPSAGPLGVWQPVTLPKADMTGNLDCGNYGAAGVVVDPLRPANLYVTVNCQGIWKSTDFGATWNGPINIGKLGQAINGAGAISVASAGSGAPPVIMMMFKRDYQGGAGANGFYVSLNDGVDWAHYPVSDAKGKALDGPYHDFYHVSVDPYDAQHLLASGHQQNLVVESSDQGKTWSTVSLNAMMLAQSGATAAIYFIDTGSAAETRRTFLYIAQEGNKVGTVRTTDGGASWTVVDMNEHVSGDQNQAFLQTRDGKLYMAGRYSAKGDGVLQSSDHGKTWTHLGLNIPESNVWVTAKNLYASYGFAVGAGQTIDPALEMGVQPGTGTWTRPTSTMSQGPIYVSTTFDGTHSIFVAANFNAGVWRYIEP